MYASNNNTNAKTNNHESSNLTEILDGSNAIFTSTVPVDEPRVAPEVQELDLTLYTLDDFFAENNFDFANVPNSDLHQLDTDTVQCPGIDQKLEDENSFQLDLLRSYATSKEFGNYGTDLDPPIVDFTDVDYNSLLLGDLTCEFPDIFNDLEPDNKFLPDAARINHVFDNIEETLNEFQPAISVPQADAEPVSPINTPEQLFANLDSNYILAPPSNHKTSKEFSYTPDYKQDTYYTSNYNQNAGSSDETQLEDNSSDESQEEDESIEDENMDDGSPEGCISNNIQNGDPSSIILLQHGFPTGKNRGFTPIVLPKHGFPTKNNRAPEPEENTFTINAFEYLQRALKNEVEDAKRASGSPNKVIKPHKRSHDKILRVQESRKNNNQFVADQISNHFHQQNLSLDTIDPGLFAQTINPQKTIQQIKHEFSSQQNQINYNNNFGNANNLIQCNQVETQVNYSVNNELVKDEVIPLIEIQDEESDFEEVTELIVNADLNKILKPKRQKPKFIISKDLAERYKNYFNKIVPSINMGKFKTRSAFEAEGFEIMQEGIIKGPIVTALLPNYARLKKFKLHQNVGGFKYEYNSNGSSSDKLALRWSGQNLNFYDPKIVRYRLNEKGNHIDKEGLCPYCPIDYNSDLSHNFHNINQSLYMHHVCKNHGVFSTGQEMPVPGFCKKDNKFFAMCVDCKQAVNLQIKLPNTDTPSLLLENGMISYFRHQLKCHNKTKKMRTDEEKAALNAWYSTPQEHQYEYPTPVKTTTS